ncbi:MAG: phosphodiester glycosidase family protein [Acidimicrobiales bacterium]
MRPRPHLPRTRRWRTLGVLLAVALSAFGWSYGGYLTAAGNAPVAVRTVDWARDHGFETVVDRAEQWWYTRSKPTGTRPSAQDLPPRSGTQAVATTAAVPIPVVVHPARRGEGRWRVVDGLTSAPGSVQETFVRPDPGFPSVSAAVVRLDQRATRLVFVPGLRQPGVGHWSWGSEIPPAVRPTVVAAFNAGFKFKDTRGGLYTEGRHTVRPLATGLASIVIHRDGTADVADWGRDAHMSSDVVSVRQNLSLIVDHGRPVPGLLVDRGSKWGKLKSQFQFTWRSGLGVDREGRLLYVAGRRMTLTELAAALTDAGAVRGMQLDIHSDVVTFNWFRPVAGSATAVRAAKLMPSMQLSATRYLRPDQRDFLAVLAR